MKAGPILALILLILVGGATGYYLYNFYGLQSSTSTTTPSTSCPPGQVLINGACSNNCANGRRIRLHVTCSHHVRTVLQTRPTVMSSTSVQTEQPTRPLACQLSNAPIQVGSIATSIIQPDSHSSTPASQPQES